MKRGWLLGLTVFLIAAGVAVYHFATRPTATPTLRVGVLKHESTLPIYVAQEMDYFDSLPYKVELIELPIADHMPALLSKRVDVISPTSFPVLMNVMGDSPGSVYALFPGAETLDGNPVYGFVVKRSFTGTSVRDFSGGVIIAINVTTALNIPAIMLGAGVSKDNLPEVRQASREAAIQAVSSGVAVAAIMDQPALAIAEDAPDLKVIEPNPRARYIHDPYWSGAGGVLTSTWKSREHDLQLFVEAVDKGIIFSRQNPKKSREILAKYLGLDVAVTQRAGGYFFPTSTEPVPIADIETTAEALESAGIIKQPVDLKQFFPPNLYQ